MSLSPEILWAAPRTLLLIGAAAALVGVWLMLWVVSRIGLRLIGRATRPIGFSGALFGLVAALGMGAVAALMLGLCVALAGYGAVTARTHVAEIQCILLAPTKLRLYYVGFDAEGRRGPTETYDLDGDEFSVGGEVLRLRPTLTMLGLSTVHAVHRIEGHWLTAADANAHKATAYDRDGGAGRGWWLLERHGTRGPLAWFVAGVHGESVSQQPDRRAVYDLYVTPTGYILDKHRT